MSQYNTGQRDSILAFFSSHREKAFTPEEVIASIDGAVQSTVYRLIPRLVEEGHLVRLSSGRGYAYRYSDPERCPNHMHVECAICGRTCHLDESISEELGSLIERATGYGVLQSTVIKGICPECRAR